MLMAPGFVSSEFGDEIPLIIGGPGEIHGIDLCTSTESGTPWIQYA